MRGEAIDALDAFTVHSLANDGGHSLNGSLSRAFAREFFGLFTGSVHETVSLASYTPVIQPRERASDVNTMYTPHSQRFGQPDQHLGGQLHLDLSLAGSTPALDSYELVEAERSRELSLTSSLVDIDEDRPKLRELARLLLESPQSHDFEVLVRGAVGVLAAKRLARIGDLRPVEAEELVSEQFPRFEGPVSAFSSSGEGRAVDIQVGELLIQLAEGPVGLQSTLAWLYQYLKTPREEASVASAHRPRGEKLGGRRLLDATQFFTESYMVNHLVAATLDPSCATTVRVVDPACGGGNFLIAALSALVAASADTRTAVDRVFRDQLTGYELDPLLGEIASLSLWLAAAELVWPPQLVHPRIEVGVPGDELGYLGHSETGHLFDLRPQNPDEPLTILTNPPFLGRRLMSSSLREELRRRYPLAGNDLAAAFLMRLVDQMRPGDRLGIVAPTNWMHLDTFSGLRRFVFDRVVIENCVDLGTGAFRDLSGDKVRVCLLTLVAGGSPTTQSRFLRLVDLQRNEKMSALKDPPQQRLHTVPFTALRSSAEEGVRYHLSEEVRRIFSLGFSYADVAQPTQGSSTGDNSRFVRAMWLGPADDPEWKLASKGGGYARWAGLSSFRVHWGEHGEVLAARPGSALRNPNLVDHMGLVFSDTGTRGLSVRRRLPYQIPIASGPGIIANEGHEGAHLAVLNSRLMSTLIRVLTPKFTIAPGYLAKLPISSELVADARLAELGERCVSLKTSWLSRRLGNAEYLPPALHDVGDIEEAVTRAIRSDIETELSRLEAEGAIELRVGEHFSLSSDALAFIEAEAGQCAGLLPERDLDLEIEEADRFLGSILDSGLRLRSTKQISGLPCDGPLEAMALALGVSPSVIAKHLLSRVEELEVVRTRYRDDLLHQAVLSTMGFRSDGAWVATRMSVSDVAARVAEVNSWPVDAGRWLIEQLPSVHAEALRPAPVLHVDSDELVLAR